MKPPSSCRPRLKYWADYSNKNPDELGKITNLQRKVDDVKTVMLGNIEEVIKRGEKLADLDSKADALAFEADRFKSSGIALRKKMWWQQTKWQIVGGICVAILVRHFRRYTCSSTTLKTAGRHRAHHLVGGQKQLVVYHDTRQL